MAGGMNGRGYVWQGGMHGGHAWGACMVGGHAWQGDMHGRGHAWQGMCMTGGPAWQGVCIVGGTCMAGETATAADGTHPTGMYSCLLHFFVFLRCLRSDSFVTKNSCSIGIFFLKTVLNFCLHVFV